MTSNSKENLKTKFLKPSSTFFSKNLVAIVMIPTIIGLHYGWLLLQENEALVKKEEKINMPIKSIFKLVTNEIRGKKKEDEKSNTEIAK